MLSRILGEISSKDLNEALRMHPNANVAKNVVLFVGNDMGISTVTKILKGQAHFYHGKSSLGLVLLYLR